MPDKRINEITNTSADPIRDQEYLAIDSSTSGSQKVTINGLVGGTKCKIVTKESDLPAAVGSVITLVSNVCYIVRGDISTANGIDLNGASIVGAGKRDNSWTYTATNGAAFTGDASGELSGLTLLANGGGTNKLFDLDASLNAGQVLDFKDLSISQCDNIGDIKGYSIVRANSLNFQANLSGLTLEDISELQIDSDRWYANNTSANNISLVGTFTNILINGGRYDVASTKNHISFSGVTSVSGGCIGGFSFTGSGTFSSGTTPSNLSIFGKDGGATVIRENFIWPDAEKGWAIYDDSTYTSGSPLSVNNAKVQLTNDGAGGNTLKTYLPSGITDFWDTSTNKITPGKIGDAYDIRIDFTADPVTAGDWMDLILDIGTGGSPIPIVQRQITLKNNGANKVSVGFPIFSLATFLTNGGTLYVDTTSSGDSIDIYDIAIFIKRDYSPA